MEQMQAANDLRAILTAAEQAVARDDAASAERLLRDALALQESSAESPRDEVAKTLNNLAVVCEMTGKIADAETCYRRAYAIATATLPASDPFVTTSRENLEEFCKSQGLPFERAAAVAARAPSATAPAPTSAAPKPPALATTPAPTPTPVPAPPRPAPLEPARVFSPPPQASRIFTPPPQASRIAAPVPTASSGMLRSIIVGVLGVVALVAVMLAARSWFASGASPDQPASVSQPQTAPAPAPAATPAPPPAPAATPAPPPAAAASTPPPETAPDPEPAAPATAVAPAPNPVAPGVTKQPEPSRTKTTSAAPKVVSAQLCRSLAVANGSWRCDAVSGTFGPGPLVFFTRVASTRDAVIEHRWYRGDSLHQRVELRIRANQSGFRTYSRTTVTPDRAGKWKVELRAADGRVLQEETFNVR